MIPSVADERAMALARKYPPLEPQLSTPWRSNGPVVSAVFFVLTVIAVAATFGFFHLLELPKGIITAAVAIGVAEVLIGRYRFFGTGVESALWIGGLFALIFGLPGEGKPEAILLFAAASFIAAARVRNALFGTLGFVFILAYLDARGFDLTALVTGLVVMLMAVVALSRQWQRPSTELFFAVTAAVMPAVAAMAGPRLHSGWAILWVVVAAGMLLAGVRMRHHFVLVGSAVAAVVAAIAVQEAIPLRREWRLIAFGALALAAAAVVTRLLRGRERGVVLMPEADNDALEILATLQLSPSAAAAPPPERSGGSFGGAGASGEF